MYKMPLNKTHSFLDFTVEAKRDTMQNDPLVSFTWQNR